MKAIIMCIMLAIGVVLTVIAADQVMLEMRHLSLVAENAEIRSAEIEHRLVTVQRESEATIKEMANRLNKLMQENAILKNGVIQAAIYIQQLEARIKELESNKTKERPNVKPKIRS